MNIFKKRLKRLPLFLMIVNFMRTDSMAILLIVLHPLPRKASGNEQTLPDEVWLIFFTQIIFIE